VKQLGDILLEGGHLTQQQLATAVDEQRRLGRSLGRVLVDMGMLSEGQLVAALATQIGLRFVDLSDYAVDGSAVSRCPAPVCRRHTAIPIGYEDGKLVVAMADPANVFAVDDIRSMTGLEVKSVVATKADVLAAIDRYHRGDDEMDELSSAIDVGAEDDDDLSRGHRDRRGRADRQVRQPAHHPGHPGPGLRHPHRAGREGPARPLPHRRRAARGDALAEVDHLRRHQPAQDHGGHQHRRAAHPAGRPAVGQRQRQEDRPARGDPAHRVGREDRHAHPGQLHGDAEAVRPRLRPGELRRLQQELRQAVRDDPGDRADRVRQVDHPLRHAEHRQQARGQRHHRRGPGRVPAARHQPGADQRQGRA
jgi:hypothetical protein